MRDSMPAFVAEDILRVTGGSLSAGRRDGRSFGVSTDSRTTGEGNLFIALRGDRFDGHDFLEKAVEKGAAGLVVERGTLPPGNLPPGGGLFVVSVTDTLRALGDLARFWRDRFALPVIAVTGSSGKTTTKDMIGTVLSRWKKTWITPGNWNNLVGVPKVLFGIREDHEAAVIEMGTNRIGEIGRLTEIARPTVGVITNIGRAHLEGFKSLDRVGEEKGSLFRGMDPGGTIVVNEDDGEIRKAATAWKGKAVSFGIRRKSDVRAEEVSIDGIRGIRFTLGIGSFRGAVSLPLFGLSNVSNALAAAAACHAAGLGDSEILEGFRAVRPVPGRLSVQSLAGGVFLADDTYNANPDSLQAALETLEAVRGGGRVHLVLGDMLELGEEGESLHREAGRRVGKMGIETLLLKGRLMRRLAEGAEKEGMDRERTVFVKEPGEAVALLRGSLRKGDWILVKGSRGMKMDAFSEALRAAFGVRPEGGTAKGGDKT